MRKETEHLLTAVAVCLLVLLIMWARVRVLQKEVERLRNAPADTVLVTHTDTIFSEKPVPVYKYISRTEFVEVPSDSVRVDTVKELVFLPREYMVYKDSTYRAVVSGVQPRLDSIEVYRKTQVQTITHTVRVPDRKRWGLGVQVGAGFNGKEVQPYVGLGVSYDIVRW
jgi:hypothetical protein